MRRPDPARPGCTPLHEQVLEFRFLLTFRIRVYCRYRLVLNDIDDFENRAVRRPFRQPVRQVRNRIAGNHPRLQDAVVETPVCGAILKFRQGAGKLFEGPSARQVAGVHLHALTDRHQHRLLGLLALAEVQWDQRAGVPSLRLSSGQELRVMKVSESAVQRPLEPFDVRGVVLPHGYPPFRSAGPGVMHEQVGSVEDDPPFARALMRFIEQTLVDGPDAVGVDALEQGRIAGRVVGDGAGCDERNACHGDRHLGDLWILPSGYSTTPGRVISRSRLGLAAPASSSITRSRTDES